MSLDCMWNNVGSIPLRGKTLAVLLLAALPAAAQNQLWIDQFGTPAEEFSLASAPDGAGGVFVGGLTKGSLGGPAAGDNDAWLARYDATGGQAWIRQFGTNASDGLRGAAPDGLGGVYMVGTTYGDLSGPSAGAGDVFLVRYDGSGAELWARQIGSDVEDVGLAAAPDGAGGVYIVGGTDGDLGGPNAGQLDAWLARYDQAGQLRWIRQLGTAGQDGAVAAATDGSGGLYLGGTTIGALGGPHAGSSDAWLARYDDAGNQLWVRQLGTGGYDELRAVAPDGSGGIYAGGATDGSLGGPSAGGVDVWLARYDDAGNQLWVRQVGSSDYDRLDAATFDGAGLVYFAGSTLGDLNAPNAGNWDAWLARYDGAGNAIGALQFGEFGYDEAWTAAPDGVGGLFLAGATNSSLGGPVSGGRDAWLARYEPCSVEKYCIGAINSTGQGASIGHQGSTSIGRNDLVLTVNSCPPQQPGIFIFGNFKTQSPFGEGLLCVTGGVKRLLPAVFLNASGAGTYPIDFTDPNSPASTIASGSVRHFQFWYRDPQMVGNGFNLSDGMTVYFCP